MKWLHISDLHIDSTYTTNRNTPFYKSVFQGLRDKVKENHVDFIVFTGDLFNQGKWHKGQKDAALLFLNDIYRICGEESGWDWTDEGSMDRLFYCPGNHDVFRDAYYVQDDSFVIQRSTLLESLRSNDDKLLPSDGYFFSVDSKNKLEHQVLTTQSFSLFDKAMQNCGEYASGKDNEFLYEFRVFKLPDTVDNKKTAIIGLNTALLAGLPYSQKDVNNELAQTWASFQQAHSILDFKKAQESYSNYQRAHMKLQGLLKDDEKHLCFISQKASDALESALEDCDYPILFGHHPISYFSDSAQQALKTFARNVNAQIYLCGHTHKPSAEVIPDGYRLNLSHIYSITVGGIFIDETGYNEINFAIEEFEYEPKPRLKVSSYTYIKGKDDMYGYDHWVERKTNPLELKTPPSTNAAATPLHSEEESTNRQLEKDIGPNNIDQIYVENKEDVSKKEDNKENPNISTKHEIDMLIQSLKVKIQK